MSAITRHMEEESLRVLIFGMEDSAEYRRVAAHVETCGMCQDRLEQMTGAQQVLDKAATLLKGTNETVVQRNHGEESDSFDPSEYLSLPSHPELLGKLGRYDIEKVIGSGGMGIVFKGFDTDLNRPVAVKVLNHHLSHKGASKQRFAREARAAAAVVHEHVVGIYDVQTSGNHPFLVMHYVHGDSLQTRVDRDGPLRPAEILRIGMHAASGLAAAHQQGVIHRDVKPGNILLENGMDRALLTDFGLARTIDEASLTSSGIVTGTPHYMSPEQAGGEAVDQRTDLFSLGSVLYFMATGHPPFRAERAMGVLNRICHHNHRPVWQVNPEIPDSLARIIDRLLEKKPSRRFGSALETQNALAKALEQLQRGRQPRWSQKLGRWWQTNKKPVTVGTLGLAGLIGMGWLGFASMRFWSGRTVLSEISQAKSSDETKVLIVSPEPFHWENVDPYLLKEAFHPEDTSAELKALSADLDRLEKDASAPGPFEDPWQNKLTQLRTQLDQLLKSLFSKEIGKPSQGVKR